jgi:hypothetical protein
MLASSGCLLPKLCYDCCSEKKPIEQAAPNHRGGYMWRARTIGAVLLIGLSISLPSPLLAQAKGKGIRLWNLTTATMSGFQLSPAGKTDWGPNQTLNDRDKEVDHDERLRITGVEPGRYDARVSYPDSRQCVVRDIEIKADAVFSISDKDLKDCTK